MEIYTEQKTWGAALRGDLSSGSLESDSTTMTLWLLPGNIEL